MVDSDRGITNLHVPSDIIVDASMPAAIRTSGQMWNAAGDLQDTQFVIPDSSYAPLYARDRRLLPGERRFRPGDDGHHPQRRADGAEGRGVRLARQDLRDRRARQRFASSTPPVPRCSSTRSRRATSGAPARPRTRPSPTGCASRSSGPARPAAPAVFWLDETRAHDAEILKKVRAALAEHDTSGLTLEFLPVAEATRYTLERAKKGEDTIAVTGNVLRDYLTDLFPILELGTSAKMLSIVPLLHGRRAVRDRCRRLGAQARPAVREGGPPALGFAGRVPGARGVAGVPGRQVRQQARRHPRPHARRRDRPHPGERQVAARARSTSSTTAAATSTWRCTGPRRSPSRPKTRSSPSCSAAGARSWRMARRRSSVSSRPCRATRSTSVATTSSTARRPTPPCGPARR